MTQNDAPAGPAAIFQMMQATHATAVLNSGIQLGVFGAIDAGARDAAAIAKKIDCPERTTKILVEALCVLGLLEKKGTSYALTPLSSDFLVPTKPQYLGGMADLFGASTMWQAMAHLPEAIKSGGTVLPEHAETPRHPFWETFARSTIGMSMPSAMAVSALLKPWLATRKDATVLDIAAGSGTYGYTIAKDSPNAQVTLLDWPNVLAEAKQNAKKLGADTGRVAYIEGNLFEVPYGGPYDVVLLSHVFHHFEPAVCEQLMKKAAAAVKPGGRLVIHDFLTDGENPAARMFAVTMVGWTRKGEAFAGADYEKWCKSAGLTNFATHRTEGLPATVMIAEKG